MKPQQLAHEFFLGIREAMVCPDVSVAEYEGVIAHKLTQAILEEREACAKLVEEYLENEFQPLRTGPLYEQ